MSGRSPARVHVTPSALDVTAPALPLPPTIHIRRSITTLPKLVAPTGTSPTFVHVTPSADENTSFATTAALPET